MSRSPRKQSVAPERTAMPAVSANTWLRRVALAGVYGLLPATLAGTNELWHGFEAGKAWVIQGVIALTFPAWLALAWRDPSARPSRTLVGVGMAVNLLGMAASLPLAVDWHRGFWGGTEHMAGLVTHLHLAAWFLMATGLLRTREAWGRLALLLAASAAVSSVAGVLELISPGILGHETRFHRAAGFQGNPVFLGSFLATAILAVPLAWTALPRVRRPSWVAVAAWVTLGAGLLGSGSRGGVLAVVAGIATVVVAWVAFSGRTRALGAAGAAFVLVGAAYVWVLRVGVHAAGLQGFWKRNLGLRHLFDPFDDADRLRTWHTALDAFLERPLVGWGHANFEAVYDAYYDPVEACVGLPQTSAHNLVLELLATRGLLGLATFCFLMAAVVITVVRAVRAGRLDAWTGALALGLVVATHVPQGFNPDSPTSLVTAAFSWALVAAVSAPASSAPIATAVIIPRWLLPTALTAGLVGAVTIDVLPAMASWHATRALRAHVAGRRNVAWAETRAAAQVPSPYLEEQLAVGLQQLVTLGEKRGLAGFPAWRELLSVDRDLATRYLHHHRRPFFWRSWLVTLDVVGAATGDAALVEEAAVGFRALLEANPRRQELHQAWGEALAGRGQFDQAAVAYQRAVELDPSIGSSHFRAGAFAWRHRDDADVGASRIREGTRVACAYWGSNPIEVVQVGFALRWLKDREGLGALVSFLESGALPLDEKSVVALAGFLRELGLDADHERLLRLAERTLRNRRRTYEALRRSRTSSDTPAEAR